MAADKNQTGEGEPHKQYRLGHEGIVLESYVTAKKAMQAYPKLREVVLMANPNGRLIIRDGNSEINYHQLKQEAAKEG
jgi:hypothetical protein